MADPKIILYNESLKNLVDKLKISPETKASLISKIPRLDLKERMSLFRTLTKIYLLDLEEKKALERIKKFWVK
jgi:hypothetical protein